MPYENYVRQAIELAKKGFPNASPNPLVGCVIVKNGKIIATGYHKKFGGPHAEIEALKQAGSKAAGATMIVSLEPCSHWGKTPPCAEAIVKAKIARVVIAMPDPNPKVNGKGIKFLKNHGVKVQGNILDGAATALNLPFITQMRQTRPYIVLKAAMTLDGKIADFNGNSRWITDSSSRDLVHQLRSQFDAILVGAGTVIADNPTLTSHGYGRNPIRVVLDPNGRIPANANVLTDGKAPTIIVLDTRQNFPDSRHSRESGPFAELAAPGAPEALIRNPDLDARLRGHDEKKGVEVLKIPQKNRSLNLSCLLQMLAQRNIQSLLVEGGGATHAHFVENGLFDELIYFIAPKILGGSKSKTPVEGGGLPITKALKLGKIEVRSLGNTTVIRASNNKYGLFWSMLEI